MTVSNSLPPRPSLDSLRKQAKKLARDVAAGDATAIARAREHLPNVDPPLTQRNAQLVIAREYGFAGWQELMAEVSKRLGKGLDWAVAQADRIIHDNDVERLKELLAEYPALLSWKADDSDGGLLNMATSAYGDAGDAQREEWFTRGACAELLLDAGAIVRPELPESLLRSRARGLLELFHRRDALPPTLKFSAALGAADAVRAALAENPTDPTAITEAFVHACGFNREAIATLLLQRVIALDPKLGAHVDESPGRAAFIRYFIDKRPEHATTVGLWTAFVMKQVERGIHDNDLTAFVGGLQREPWLLDDTFVWFQERLISVAALNGRDPFIAALLDLDPAILRSRPPPPSQATEFAFTYANTHVIPLLTRIWPMPDDLPHAAGMGDLASVKRWFDPDGKPALGNVANHQPATSVHARERQWGDVGVQQVLDTALAWAVINRHFAVADFLLEHGANVSTNWNSHEPASILHHLVFQPNPYEPMQFLIDRGIDMTIKDYRWNGTAQGWAFHALNDPKMAEWLANAERQQRKQ